MILQVLSITALALSSGTRPPYQTSGREIEASFYTFERANDIRFQVRNYDSYLINELFTDSYWIGYQFNYTEGESVVSYHVVLDGGYSGGYNETHFADMNIDYALLIIPQIYREYSTTQRGVISCSFEYSITGYRVLTLSNGQINTKWQDEQFLTSMENIYFNFAAIAKYSLSIAGDSDKVVKTQNSSISVNKLYAKNSEEVNIYLNSNAVAHDSTRYYLQSQQINYLTIALSQMSSSADYQSGYEKGNEDGFWDGYNQGILDESRKKVNPVAWIMDALKSVQDMAKELAIFESFTLWDIIVISITIPFITWLFKIFI